MPDTDLQTKDLIGMDGLLDPPAPPPVVHRRFDDAPGIREAIFDNVLKAAQSKYPIENTRHRLELQNLAYDDPHRNFTPLEQKDAVLKGKTLHRKLMGDWVLFDKESNKEVDRKSGVVAHVPWMADDNCFVFNGSWMTLASQPRLKPGSFARQKDNGEIESHINVKPGTGPGHRLYMEPETGIFRLGLGQSTLKLYPVLKSMGVTDEELEKHWGGGEKGKELVAKNREAEDPRAVQRAFDRLVGQREELSAAAEGPEAEGQEKQADLASKSYRNCDHCGTEHCDDPHELDFSRTWQYECPHCGGRAFTGEPAEEGKEPVSFRGSAKCLDCGESFAAVARKDLKRDEKPGKVMRYPYRVERAEKKGPETKGQEKAGADRPNDFCPDCGKKQKWRCRCQRHHAGCEDKHSWMVCDKHGQVSTTGRGKQEDGEPDCPKCRDAENGDAP